MSRKTKIVDKIYYIVNDRDQTFEADRITDQLQISDEDEKYWELSELAGSRFSSDSWIDIKGATDKITTNGVKTMIEKWLLGEFNNETELQMLNKGIGELDINPKLASGDVKNEQIMSLNPRDTLMNREKGAHLTYDQQLYIYSSYNEGEKLADLCKRVGVSTSTCKRIIKIFSKNLDRNRIYCRIRCRKVIDSIAIKNWISNFVRSQTACFVASDVQARIQKQLRVVVPIHQIRMHLKKVHNLSFKKGNPRLAWLDFEKIKLMRRLFCLKLAQRLNEIKLLVNMDESTINQDTKQNYSWLQRGKSWSVQNIKFKKSINVIAAVTTTGLCINMFKYGRTTKETVITFIKFLLNYLKNHDQLSSQDIAIVLDNCAPHRAKNVMEYCKAAGVKLYYLPQYSPELAPIEVYFSKLKKDIIRSAGMKSIQLDSEEAIQIIKRWAQGVDPAYAKKIWSRMLNQTLNELEALRIN